MPPGCAHTAACLYLLGTFLTSSARSPGPCLRGDPTFVGVHMLCEGVHAHVVVRRPAHRQFVDRGRELEAAGRTWRARPLPDRPPGLAAGRMVHQMHGGPRQYSSHPEGSGALALPIWSETAGQAHSPSAHVCPVFLLLQSEPKKCQPISPSSSQTSYHLQASTLIAHVHSLRPGGDQREGPRLCPRPWEGACELLLTAPTGAG